MKTYALFCNGKFVVAKPMFAAPQSPEDFDVGAIPTSCYDICRVDVVPILDETISIKASIDVGAPGLLD